MHALCLPFNRGEALALGRRIRDWGRLVLETHARGHLAEEARRFDGRLRVHEHSLAAEHVLIQREQGGPQHAQKVVEVQRWVGVHMVLSCRIANELVGNSPKCSERGTHLVPIAAIVNIKIKFLAPPMPRASATQICKTCLAQLEEPPRGRSDVLAAITLGSRIGVELARVEDAEGGETEAALAVLLRRRALA